MKVLFIQLSDMHCHAKDYFNTKKIDMVVPAIKTLGNIDGAILVFSGDLADHASKREFTAGRRLLGKLLSDLSDSLNCGFITTAIVPGNHDLLLPEGCRGASQIESWDKEEHLPDELQRLDGFFDYSKTKQCFVSATMCDVKNIEICGTSIQLCLLNSAPFSTREPEDKQLHYFPAHVAEQIKRHPNADLKITIMHHHYEWCEWGTKEMLKKAIDSDDITFFGHDHKSEVLSAKYADGKSHNIIMGGRFSLDTNEEATFNAVLFDTESKTLTCREFRWAPEEAVFYSIERGSLPIKADKYAPAETYISRLLSDTQNISKLYTDYFVFPSLTAEGEAFSAEEKLADIRVEDIYRALRANRVIRITGNSNSGKTALLRYLYSKAVDYHYLPLLIEKRDYKDSRIDKMLRDLYEDQYQPTSDHAFEAFEQLGFGRTVVFVDDLDLIANSKARENLIERIISSGKYLIYTTKEKNQDLEDIVKDKLQSKEISTISIAPFYKVTRDQLIENVGKLMGKDADTIDSIKIAFDYMVQSQTNLFDFTPSNTLQYIKYLMNGDAKEKRVPQTLSMVFETNIRTAIIHACGKDAIANVYLLTLEYIADQMYFGKRAERISISEYSSLISEYNAKKKASINERAFLDTCVAAHIFSQGIDSFDVQFYDKNTYAYFVAKSISREFEKDHSNIEKLTHVMNHICFGINDTIIMFLSFIRSNTQIAIMVAKEADQLLKEAPEWNLDKRNLPFLQSHTTFSQRAPSQKDRQDNNEQLQRVEQNRHEMIKFRGIFDFDENDVDKPRYVTMRAFKFLQLIGRALVDQYGALEADDIEMLLSTVFRVAQKVIFATLKPYQDHCDEIVASISAFISEKMPDDHISDDQIRKLLGQVGTILALNIMNDISYIISNESTIAVLREGPKETSNYKIMELMMEENAGNTTEFISRAIALHKEIGDNPYARVLISQIARKHIIYNGSIDHRNIDRLISERILSKDSKSVILLEKGSKEVQ